MRLRQWLSLFLILATGFSLAACTVGGSGGTETSGMVPEATAEEQSKLVLDLVTDGKSKYIIYYPEDEAEELYEVAALLQTALKDYTGASVECTGDLMIKGQSEDPAAYEILIGYTNRSISRTVFEGVGFGEYKIEMQGTKLAICGDTNKTTAEAVRYFIKTHLQDNRSLKKGSIGSLRFSPEQNYYLAASRLIKTILIDGTPISEFKLVIPEGSYVADYLARILQRYIAQFQGSRLEIVTDRSPAVAHEIRFGMTSRTQSVNAEGEYLISVTNGSLEIACGNLSGYVQALNFLRYQLLSYSQANIRLDVGQQWKGDDQASKTLKNSSDIRIMYHNTWGYLDGSNPVANRAEMAKATYEELQPDVLCFEEMSAAYRNHAAELMTWLSEHYGEICYTSGGTGNPIFYKKTVFECVESGYEKARNGDKGTTWAVLKCISNGKLLIVTNSHFAANNNAGDDLTLGNEYRVMDAGCILKVREKLAPKYPGVDMIIGGDFNADITADPYKLLADAGFINVRDRVENAPPYSPYNTGFSNLYNAERKEYELVSFANNPAKSSIDHIMVYGNTQTVTVDNYEIVTHRISCTASDHLPHFIDLSWK